MHAERRFHARMAEIAGNPLLVEFLRPIHERMSRILHLPHWRDHDYDLTEAEHEEIYHAVERQDATAARNTMERHIESLRQRILDAGGK